MFKKRVKGVTKDQSKPLCPRIANHKAHIHTQTPPKFDQANWSDWLRTVNKFCVFSRQLSPLFIERDNDNRPYISIHVFDVPLVGLLDSGANNSIVGRTGISILTKLGLRWDKSDINFVTTADNRRQEVIGIVELPVRISDSLRLLKAYVVPSLDHSLILGSDFCRLFSLQVNFKEKSWHLSSDGDDLVEFELKNEPHVDAISLSELTLSPAQREIARLIIEDFREISGDKSLGRTNKLTMSIDTGDEKPFKLRQYPMSPAVLKILHDEVDEMLKLDVIEESHSPWSSPVLMVPKKNGEKRFCFDARRLNKITKHDSYPLPRVDRILSMLKDAKYISSIDLRKAFWRVPLDETSREKTAFAIPGKGLYHFKVMPFGLCNSAQNMQRVMDSIFGPRYEPNIFVYLDDIIVTSATFDKHTELLKEIKQRLKEANLRINLEKCDFFKSSLRYLGYVVDVNGLRTHPEKITAMLNYPRPTNTTEVKRFMGMCGWYRRFIKNFSTICAPINDLLKGHKHKKAPILWTPEADIAFTNIKQALVSAPILSSPDFSQPFVVQCDASDTGIGGVLTQDLERGERVIAFASRSLSRSERNYSVTERECLAAVFCTEVFRPYIEGTPFTLITDHYSLLWLDNLKEPTGKLARWVLKLRQYHFTMVHRKGKCNVVPDALSRAHNRPSQISAIDFLPDDGDQSYRILADTISRNPLEYPLWKVENDLVYKKVRPHFPTISNELQWKYLVPVSKRMRAIEDCHSPPTSGHFGVFKTLGRVSELYYWPKMRKDVVKFVRKCRVCAEQKIPNVGPSGLMGREKRVSFPWQVIAVDFMGPFPPSPNRNQYLLVISDWFTKYTLLFPLRKANAPAVIKILEDQVFLTFGTPQFIVCDNGTLFAGREFKRFADKYEVQKIWFNARYHPQANFVERTNKTVGTAIRSYLEERHELWDKNLSEIRFAINSARHEVTGYPPSYLNFGRYVPLSGKYYGSLHDQPSADLYPGDRDQYSLELEQLSTSVYDEIRQKLNAAYRRYANRYNTKRRNVEYNVGDKVWRRNHVMSDLRRKVSAKLAKKYVIARIVEKISPLVYRLTNDDNTNAGRYHVKDLKPYFGSNSDVSFG